jgi:hypothetical protein
VWHSVPQRQGRGCTECGQHDPLLLFKERLKRPLRLVLSFEELTVELGGLLAELLKRSQVLLDGPQGLRQER